MFKKLKYLFLYIRIVNKNREFLKIEHGISVDWVYRLYKTYTISNQDLDDIKVFGIKYFNEILRKEISRIDETFIKLGLSELSGLMEIVELNEKQIGMAFRFKYLNTAKFFGKLIWVMLYSIGALFGYLIGTYIGLGVGLLSIFILYLFTRIFV